MDLLQKEIDKQSMADQSENAQEFSDSEVDNSEKLESAESPITDQPSVDNVIQDEPRKADPIERDFSDSIILTDPLLANDQNLETLANVSYDDITKKLPMLSDPAQADQMISVNFDQTDIRMVVKTISDITGINFIMDDAISGTVSVLSPTKIRLGDLYEFLESILDVKGYAAVPSEDHVKIIPRADASKRNLRIRIGGEPDDIPQNDTVVTQLITLKYADATEVKQILSTRLPANGEISVYPRTNKLLITGTSSMIFNMAVIIKQLDVPNAKEEFSVIPLYHASADKLSQQILQIMQDQDNNRIRRTGNQTTQTIGRVQVQPESRTNSLIVIANAHDTQVIHGLVERLDIERPIGMDNVHVVYLKNAQAEEISESLSLAMANIQVTDAREQKINAKAYPDVGTNSLIINASPQDFEIISSIIAKLDIARDQVLVELKILEISDENLREIGIDWATLDNAVADSIRLFGKTNFDIMVKQSAGTLEGLSIGAFKDIGGDVKIGAIMNALEQVSDVNILSTPHVVTSNHRKAKILVGDNIPYVKGDRLTETDPATPTIIRQIDYKDVGVSLEITPHISQGGMLSLKIDSQFSQLIDSVTGLSADTPTTAKREVTTEVTMADGSTIIIGGLIRDDKSVVEKKIPLLGDIPLLGNLFKYKRDRIQKTNLLLFITPHILRTTADIAKVSTLKEEEVIQNIKTQN